MTFLCLFKLFVGEFCGGKLNVGGDNFNRGILVVGNVIEAEMVSG